MRPAEVLDVRAGIVDYLGTAPYRTELGRGHVNRVPPGSTRAAEQYAAGEWMAEKIRTALRKAQAFHVQEDMTPLLLTAAADLDEDDFLIEERLPANEGFLLFDAPIMKPMEWHDGTMLNSTIHGLSWANGASGAYDLTVRKNHPGIWIDTWTRVDDPANTTWAELDSNHPGLRQEWVSVRGPWWPSERFHLGFGDHVGPVDVTQEQYATLLGDMHFNSDDASERPVLNQTRIVVALFRLLNQVIVSVSDATIDRPTARRSQRAGLPAEVRTIALRRRTTDPAKSSAGTPRDWHHSWVVRGHWAWRACGEAHDYAEEYDRGWHARVYIAPYIKGPEGKPIHVTEKVWDLSR